MSTDRRLRLWELVVKHARGTPVTIEDVCAVMVTAAGVDGAAVTVTLSAGARETLYASDPVASDLTELALTLGEGPSVEGSAGTPALVADLATVESMARWPIFAPLAFAAGARAVFALPLQVGGIRLGVIDLYRGRPGPLSKEQVADGLTLADTACAMLIDSTRADNAQGDATQRTGRGANGRVPEHVGLQHPEVHQATGMIIAQLGVTAAVALVRLRAYAYANDRRLRDVARDVVARRLRFPSDEQIDG
jgi:hypothetical protein